MSVTDLRSFVGPVVIGEFYEFRHDVLPGKR